MDLSSSNLCYSTVNYSCILWGRVYNFLSDFQKSDPKKVHNHQSSLYKSLRFIFKACHDLASFQPNLISGPLHTLWSNHIVLLEVPWAWHVLFLLCVFFFFFSISRAAPVAYGSSQARGRIGAVASRWPTPQPQQCCIRLRLQPTPQPTAPPNP